MESNKKIINGKEKLTHYMFHNSISHIVAADFNQYKNYHINSINVTLNSLLNFKKIFVSKKSIDYINAGITDIKLDKYIYKFNEKPDYLMNYIVNNIFGIKHKIKLLLSYIFIRIYPDFRNYFYKKAWNNYKEKFINQILV